MLNKKDPLVDAVKQVMVTNEKERNAVKSVNEAFGIQSKRQLPHEKHAAYDAALSKAIKGELTEAVKEELVGNQHKIDANKNKRIDSHDFKLLRAKKEKIDEVSKGLAIRATAKANDPDYPHRKDDALMAHTKRKFGDKAVKNVKRKVDSDYWQDKPMSGSDTLDRKPGKKTITGPKSKLPEETRGKKIAESILAKLRGKKMEEEKIEEKAPPGAKFERMVKHIKKGYSKDGDLSKQEKSIAYATAWKAKNKAKD